MDAVNLLVYSILKWIKQFVTKCYDNYVNNTEHYDKRFYQTIIQMRESITL